MAYEQEIKWLRENKVALQNLYPLRVDMVCMYLKSEKLEKARKAGGQLIEGMLLLEDGDARIAFLEAQLAAKEQQLDKEKKLAQDSKKIARQRKKKKARGLPPAQKPYPPLTYYVPQGHCHILDHSMNLRFGTRGCIPCVGVVAKMTRNRIFCCHLDHDIRVPQPRNFAMRTRWHDFKDSLLSRLPSPEYVMEMSMTTSADTWVSMRTWEALKMIYGRKYIGPAEWRQDEAKEATMMQPTFSAIWWDGSSNSIKRSDERGKNVGKRVVGALGTIILVGVHLVLSNDDTSDIVLHLQKGTY